MNGARALMLAGALGLAAACEPGGPAQPGAAVAGRWQRVDQPSEWIEFAPGGTFQSRSFTGTEVEGRYRQDGATVTVTPLPHGHGATLTLQDTLLVMEEGTRYRRVPR